MLTHYLDETFQKIIVDHLAKMEVLNLPIHLDVLNEVSKNNALYNDCKKL